MPAASPVPGPSQIESGTTRARNVLVVFDVFSMAARAAVTQAHQEARSHGTDYIGTEHLLLGLIGTDGDSAVAETLHALNVTFDAIRSRIEDSIGPAGEPQSGHLPFSPRAKSALDRSRYEAEAPGHQLVQPSNILAALMFDAHSAAANTLAGIGVQPTAVRERLLNRGRNANQFGTDD